MLNGQHCSLTARARKCIKEGKRNEEREGNMQRLTKE
jgi:hypothetical protein